MRYILFLFSFFLLSCFSSGQENINGSLQSTHWSPDSTMYLEVYKQDLKHALPGQGSDHMAIIALRNSKGELVHLVDENSSNKVLLREFHSVHWETGKNMLNYAPARYIEWIDASTFDIEIIANKLSQYFKTENWRFFEGTKNFGDSYYVIGEFFNDPEYDYTLDMIMLVEDSNEVVHMLSYESFNYRSPYDGIRSINLNEDYSWVGKFSKVKAGEVLWSNSIEREGENYIRSLNEVPEKEKIRLEYDAIFIHAGESCGGAYIYWADDEWRWLQQE